MNLNCCICGQFVAHNEVEVSSWVSGDHTGIEEHVEYYCKKHSPFGKKMKKEVNVDWGTFIQNLKKRKAGWERTVKYYEKDDKLLAAGAILRVNILDEILELAEGSIKNES